MSVVSVERLLNTIGQLYSDDRIGSATASTLRGLVQESEVTDWDGEEPLRRNHRVKLGGNGDVTYIVLTVGSGEIVAVQNEYDKGVHTFNLSIVLPIKTKMERLYDEWCGLPRVCTPAPPTAKQEAILFGEWLLSRDNT